MNIIERLKKVFGWIEERDMRVGELWLHPKQIVELIEAKDPGWDRINQRAVIQGYLESKGPSTNCSGGPYEALPPRQPHRQEGSRQRAVLRPHLESSPRAPSTWTTWPTRPAHRPGPSDVDTPTCSSS